MTTPIRILAALALLGLAGCGTVSKRECETHDWYDIGVRDGARGYGEERFLDNAEACAKHGIGADREQWLAGRRHGLERYCTARNGLSVGEQRGGYGGVCPRPAEDDFLRGLALGRDLAEARGRLAAVTHEIQELRARLEPHDRPESDKSPPDEHRLDDGERIELAIRLGANVARREGLARDVAELEARAREL